MSASTGESVSMESEEVRVVSLGTTEISDIISDFFSATNYYQAYFGLNDQIPSSNDP